MLDALLDALRGGGLDTDGPEARADLAPRAEEGAEDGRVGRRRHLAELALPEHVARGGGIAEHKLIGHARIDGGLEHEVVRLEAVGALLPYVPALVPRDDVPADLVARLRDEELIHAVGAEGLRRAEAGDAGAHDDDVERLSEVAHRVVRHGLVRALAGRDAARDAAHASRRR